MKEISKTTIRESTEWLQIYRFNSTDDQLPRILLVGDSIVCGHAELVWQALKDKCNVDFYATSKCVSDIEFEDEIRFAMLNRNYRCIVFNNGLHGSEIANDVYAFHLRKLLLELRQRTPKLFWRNSTPVKDTDSNSFNKSDRSPFCRNELAAEIVKELEIDTIDLYSPMKSNSHLLSNDGIHYTVAGQGVQAEIIAKFLTEKVFNNP